MGNTQNKGSVSDSVDLSHFKLLRSIGRGSFGKVRIITHKATKQSYALKYFSKPDLIGRKMSKNIIRERNILEHLTHPFVCNLRYAFQDDYNLYMGLDLMLGGDLRFHFGRRRFCEDELVFIIAELISAIGYLHSVGVVHRDIKPDNILLDEKGHAHLTDFNIATYIAPKSKLKSNSGTAHYMAPEMISGQGYDHTIDWWSLGIVIYECVYGKTPFYETIKKSKSKQCIISMPIEYDVITDFDLTPSLLSFMQSLLVKDPSKRIPYKHGCSIFEIQKLPLFNGIEFDALEKKALKPPFCPSDKKPNFDMTYDLEELLLEDYPLESLPTKRSKDVNKMSVDMLYLENGFLDYDFSKLGKTRRYSADLTANPPANSTSNTPGNVSESESESLADFLDSGSDSLPALPTKPVAQMVKKDPTSKAFRRRSRSLVNMFAHISPSKNNMSDLSPFQASSNTGTAQEPRSSMQSDRSSQMSQPKSKSQFKKLFKPFKRNQTPNSLNNSSSHSLNNPSSMLSLP